MNAPATPHTIPAPGTPRGACQPGGCGPRCRTRALCFSLREEAASPCTVCGRSVGYGIPLLVQHGEFIDDFTHVACVMGAVRAA